MIDKLGKELADKIKLDWSHPRVICIAESFSKFDIDTVEVVPLRIDLLKYRYYEDEVFSLEPVSVPKDAAKKADELSDDMACKKDSGEELKATTIDGLIAKANPDIRQLFAELRERILSLDEGVNEKITTCYVAYRTSNNFAEIEIGKTQLKIGLRPIDYDDHDPRKIVEKVPDSYKWTMNRRTYLKSMDDIEYVMGLIEQSYMNVL